MQGSSLAYFKSAWNVVDFLSTALLFACVVVWWDFALRDALPFDINLRYALLVLCMPNIPGLCSYMLECLASHPSAAQACPVSHSCVDVVEQ